MKIITNKDIINLHLDKSIFLNWAKDVFLNKNETTLPPKISMKTHDGEGFVNVMPSIIPYMNVYGNKIVSRNPNTIPVLKSDILLYDYKTSNPVAFLEGEYITAFRTAGCAVLSIETLALPNYSVIGFIGLGNICRATILTLLSVIKDRELTIKLFIRNNSDNGISELISDYSNVKIVRCTTMKELVINSDVVVSCVTYASQDLVEDPSWFKKGCLLVPIHTRGFLNCDLVFDRVIVDDYGHTKGFKNFNQFKNCYELSEVLQDLTKGRNNPEERIITYNVGISLLDIYFAAKINQLIGTTNTIQIDKDYLAKYWVK